MNTSTMPAITPPEFRSNTRRMSAIILAEFQPGIPVEYQGNASNNSSGISAWNSGGIPGGMPAIIPAEFRPGILVECRGNAGGMPAIIQTEFQPGIPVEYRVNAGNNSGGFRRISPRIYPESTWNSRQVRPSANRNSGEIPPEFQVYFY